MRECGLKLKYKKAHDKLAVVTPRAGVWIEIGIICPKIAIKTVTPRAGVWIEITRQMVYSASVPVTPRAGVWIEIPS